MMLYREIEVWEESREVETQDIEEHRQGMRRVGAQAGTADLMAINNSRMASQKKCRPGAGQTWFYG